MHPAGGGGGEGFGGVIILDVGADHRRLGHKAVRRTGLCTDGAVDSQAAEGGLLDLAGEKRAKARGVHVQRGVDGQIKNLRLVQIAEQARSDVGISWYCVGYRNIKIAECTSASPGPRRRCLPGLGRCAGPAADSQAPAPASCRCIYGMLSKERGRRSWSLPVRRSCWNTLE